MQSIAQLSRLTNLPRFRAVALTAIVLTLSAANCEAGFFKKVGRAIAKAHTHPFETAARHADREIKRVERAVNLLPDVVKNPKAAAKTVARHEIDEAIGPPVAETVKTYAILPELVAENIPEEARRLLAEMINSGALKTADGRSPFSIEAIESARWISKDNKLAKPLFPKTYGFDNPGITHGGLIIADPAAIDVAFWAHELTHVRQYSELGHDKFIAQYLREATEASANGKDSHDAVSFEVEAMSIEIQANTWLNARAGQGGQPPIRLTK